MYLHDDTVGDNEMHDINVTPFIDVMLVLMIIFMVSAPLSTVDIHVDLPASSAIPQSRPNKPFYLTVTADKQLYVGDILVSEIGLTNFLDEQTSKNKETTIFFQADKTVDYETMMRIMEILRKSGYLKVGLVAIESARK